MYLFHLHIWLYSNSEFRLVLITALILSSIIVLLISAPIILLAEVYTGGRNISFNPANPAHWLIPLILIAAAFMSIGIGLVLSLFTKTLRGGASLGSALGSVLSFTAGIWFPRTWLPSWL
ncbi:MAG: ABC transporter permease [Desulfurococcaceae archaeon]